MRRKLLYAVGVLLLLGISATAQIVRGKITSLEDGGMISGANITVVGTETQTVSDQDGNYEIDVPANSTELEYSFVGMISKTEPINGRGAINVELETNVQGLSEVVVTGYGSQKRTNFTGAASTVKAAPIAERPVQSFTQGLTGLASGVQIVQPNGLLNNAPVIRVRGLSSLSLSSFPLIVVDGIPIAAGNVSSNSSPNSPLADINPADIESIDILKDAASTAIYGSRAAAGVLLITTKQGKVGGAKVSYDGWFGFSNAVRLPDVLNAQQFMDHKNAAIANAFEINPEASLPARNEDGLTFLPLTNSDGSLVDTRWYDYVFRRGFSQNHNVTVSGGTGKTNYYFSGGLTKQDGFLRSNSFDRRNVRFNISHEVTNWLKLTSNINYTNSVNRSPNSGSTPGAAFNTSGLGRIAIAQSPNVAPFNEDGSFNVENNAIGRGNNITAMQWSNPVVLRDLDKNSSETNRIIANLSAEINFTKDLLFKTTYSVDARSTENIQFLNPINGDGWSTIGSAYNNFDRGSNWNWVNTLQFNKSFNDAHNLSVIVGSDAQKFRTTAWGAVRQEVADDFFTVFQGNFGINLAGGNGISQISYLAYLGSISYNFKERYFLSANYRRDGNSALSEGNKWGNFGGISTGWTISEEDFWVNSGISSTISNFRLKASWGRVGNGNLGNAYGSYSTYGSGLYGEEATLAFNQAGNQDLKWETSSQTNIGLDIGFLNDRASLEVNYYNKDINNMILAVPQAPSKGIPGNSILANVGSMYNRGWEFTVNAVPVNGEHFSWTTNLNFSTNINRVTALVDENTPIFSATGGLETSNITRVGESAASLYGVRTAGVNPATGRRIFVDLMGNQVQYLHGGGANAWTYLDGSPAVSVSNQGLVLGNTIPKWFGGFNNTLSYKGFDLGLNFTFSGGNYIYNGTRAGLLDQRIWNNSTEVLTSWKTEGDVTDVPLAVWGDNISNGSAFVIEDNIEKGDFLRLQTTTLGYRLPIPWLGKSGITNVRIYAQANNLFLLTGYTGADPEISTNGDSNLGSGIERNTIPQARQFNFGLNVTF